jgi:hypothetical protein
MTAVINRGGVLERLLSVPAATSLLAARNG